MPALNQTASTAAIHEDAMSYAEFFARFGGSYRTKNVDVGPARRAAAKVTSGDPVRRAKRRGARIVQRVQQSPTESARKFAGRQVRTAKKAAQVGANRRPYRLPARSGLPPEFIRLCPWEGDYVFMLAATARAGVVETGRLRGGSTFLMSCANPAVPITSIDIAPKDDAELRHFLDTHGVGANVELIVGDSQRTVYDQVDEYDLLFVDGDHSYEGCLADLRNWYPGLAPGGHVLVHDAYHGQTVQPAVIDFLAESGARAVRTPHIPAVYWQHPTGSLAHLQKPHDA